MENTKEIWVYVETREGKPVKSSLELFSPARVIASRLRACVTGIVLGKDTEFAVQEVVACGAQKILVSESPMYEPYCPSIYISALHELVSQYQPDALMISATHNGKDFAPALACRLKTGITANCTALDVDERSGVISWMMPAPGGLMATILCEKTRPQMGTVCPGIFSVPERRENAEAEIRKVSLSLIPDPRLEVLSEDNKPSEGPALEDAEIIVAGGRGMGSSEKFNLVRQLAEKLGGVTGASRVVVDLEWAGQENLVGQTGKIVHPKLYIACGISGALQHTVGIGGAECIVAINNDAEAPIFDMSDYAVVADATKVLPAMIDLLDSQE